MTGLLPLYCLPVVSSLSGFLISLIYTFAIGHALEAGWFLLQYGLENGDQELQRTAVDKFMEIPFLTGWDKEHGGLLYFLDVDGYCPTQVHPVKVDLIYFQYGPPMCAPKHFMGLIIEMHIESLLIQ